jgi:rare lipoprotein A (peptidoglycan hydrolase)
MRWDYHLQHMSPEEGKRWWANKKIQVTNPSNGIAVIVRAVDYGPHENTGFDIGISPGAAETLGVAQGDEVEVAFADQKAPVGPVSSEE